MSTFKAFFGASTAGPAAPKLLASGDATASFGGAANVASALVAGGVAVASFVALNAGAQLPSGVGYRGKPRRARASRDDADAETVRKSYELVALKKKQAEAKQVKEKRDGAEARSQQPELTTTAPRPAAPEAPAPAPAPRAPETVSQMLERLEASVASGFETLRADALAAREEAEILALMAIAITAESH